MSEISRFMIVAGFGAICFGFGYLIAFIVTRNNGERRRLATKPGSKMWRKQHLKPKQ
jgi:hypothetical protein